MNTKFDMEKAVKLVKLIAPNINQNSLKKINASMNFKENYTIPIITDDESVKECIREFELDNPVNIIKFFVESYYANIECIVEGIAINQKLNFVDSVACISDARNKLKRALSNKGNKENFNNLLRDAQNCLDKGISELENKVFVYIDMVRQIDNQSKFMFFLKAKSSIKTVDINTELAREAIKTIDNAVQLHMTLAALMHEDIEDSVIEPFNEFKQKLIKDDNYMLMYNYDTEENKNFWLKLPETIDDICEKADDVSECMESCVDNIIFE